MDRTADAHPLAARRGGRPRGLLTRIPALLRLGRALHLAGATWPLRVCPGGGHVMGNTPYYARSGLGRGPLHRCVDRTADAHPLAARRGGRPRVLGRALCLAGATWPLRVCPGCGHVLGTTPYYARSGLGEDSLRFIVLRNPGGRECCNKFLMFALLQGWNYYSSVPNLTTVHHYVVVRGDGGVEHCQVQPPPHRTL